MMPDGHGERQCCLRYVAGGDMRPSLGNLCLVTFFDLQGNSLTPSFTLTPGSLEAVLLKGDEQVGKAAFCIGEGEVLHVKGEGIELRFELQGSRYDYAYQTPAGEPCVVAAGENLRLTPVAKVGELNVRGEWRRDHAEDVAISFKGDQFEGSIVLHERLCLNVSHSSFERAKADAEHAFAEWIGDAELGQAARLANYILWANTVPAKGHLSAPAIYMSKNHMINIWSWDNAFSAIGVAKTSPKSAFEQFAVIFDQQDASGLLPDFVHDQGASFSFTKPPVHGWAIDHILCAFGPVFDDEQLTYLADKLEKQLSYWLTHTRSGPDKLPSYAHGNDSGWDNASFFANGGPVEGPDLPTFLALSAQAIARVKRRLGDVESAAHFEQIGVGLVQLLVDQLWRDGHFVVRKTSGADAPKNSQSLIGFMPMLLGDLLPNDIGERLVSEFKRSKLLTDWGPATESPNSDFYEADGYWRGPIWAPTTLLIHDGLVAQHATELAQKVATKFVNLCEHSGMAENFNALTGEGLRDPAFAWTSAVYLRFKDILANQSGS